MADKPRYPAKFFKRLTRYPRRFCQNPECGVQLTPKLYDSGLLETLSKFSVRETCNQKCNGRRAKLARDALKEASSQKPKTKPAKPVQPHAAKGQSFYNEFRGDAKLESELDKERVARGIESRKVELDRPLMLSLFRAFAEHDEDHFLKVFEAQHPKLVKAYRRWQGRNPALRERLAA